MDTHMDISILASATGPTDKSLRVTRNKLYPKQAWYCIGLFIFIIAIFQWISFFHSKFARRRQTPNEDDTEHASVHRRHGFSWRRIPLGLANAYRVIAFRWTLEFGKSYTLNMAEVFVTMAYIVFLFVWAFVNTTDLEGQALNIRYWCNRSGILASSQFPLITALGTKNNIVSLITGISYDKLNYVHRMMSRVVFTLLWVHTGGEVIQNAPFQPYEPWLICGITAMVALTILCVVSLRPIRAQAYELFFYVHFTMVLTFLVCAYFHTQNDTITYWIYPCFIIWGLDRLIRAIGLAVFNHSYFRFKSGSTMDATAELLADDFVRLRFHRPSHFHWTPGQTAYLIMPSVSCLPFEAHPFTIASFDSSLFNVLEEPKPQSEKYAQISPAERDLGSSAPFWKELVFFINVRQGFTARLKEAASKGDKVKVLVDGPYGPSPDLGSYDTSVLIAGGSGVSYTLPTLLHIIEGVRDGKSSCGRVVFVWSIRNADHIHWIDKVLIRALRLAPPSLSISIHIHITGEPATIETLPFSYGPNNDAQPVRDGSRSDIAEFQDGKESILAIESVKLANGRPNLPAMLRDEVEMATGRMSVSVCGSHGIARSVRGALRFPVSSPLSIANGGPSVTLHIESFGYA
ncbi:ferric reductase NAD binding domain-containing protein [Suillus ampliporus]|nr:ferric reductase NAD binding domain-containing protein [Suillus ampliporus]